MRDPRKQPLPGDVVTRLGCTRTVIEIKKNTRFSKVVFKSNKNGFKSL